MASHIRIPILPEWPGPWERWARAFCTKNGWRVARVLGGEEDCLAECASLWVECRARYGSKVDNAAWFMRMYQLMVTSRFNDLSVKDFRMRSWSVDQGESLPEAPTQAEEAWALKVGSASREAKAILDVLQNVPAELLRVLLPNPRLPAGRMLEQVARFCGITDPRRVIQELHVMLS